MLLIVFVLLYLAVVPERQRNARDAAGIREIILSDDVSDSIDDGTEFDENYVEMTEGDWLVQETLRRMVIAAMKWMLLTVVLNGKDRRK